MRPSRGRFYGHPVLIAFIEDLAATLRAEGYSGLLVGDLAQPRGGPMTSGHRSHQSGLDVDIWFMPAPGKSLSSAERESLSATSMVASGGVGANAAFGAPQMAALAAAARDPRVDRIFVNAAIKNTMCALRPGGDEALRVIRPWWGHDSHFHVRLRCPEADMLCRTQEPLPAGDGCDASLDWWFSADAAAEAAKNAARPPARALTLDDLPEACRQVFADAPPP